MRTLIFLLEKEFKQIFRNRSLLPLLFILPFVQLLILPLAADYEIKNINIAIVDNDHSSNSSLLISKILASGYFRMTGYKSSFKEAYELIAKDKADLVLEIPAGFERNLVRVNNQELFIAINAINGVKAGMGGSYLSMIIADFNNEIRLDWIVKSKFQPQPVIEITSSNWFNPLMNYNFFMVPGILAILVTMVGGYMAALNIVKEKEIGTIEQINVTPIKKHYFILGKIIPFWVLGMLIFTFGLFVIARLVYGIVPSGNIAVMYLFLSVYLFALLGFGLLISTYCETQQQAMSIAFFFVMIFLLMSGLFTPIDSMPEWAQTIAAFNPVTYFIEVMRMIVLKGSGFADIKYHLLKVVGFLILFNGWAMLNYKKRS